MLDANQLAACRHREGPANIIAGPGGGKTETLVNLYSNLLRCGERPERILCATFSVDAGLEMVRRIAKQTGFSEKTLKPSIGTFHSLAYRIIRLENASLPFNLAEKPVLEWGGEKRILREMVRREAMGTARKFISTMRRLLISPEDSDNAPGGEEFAPVYRAYDEFLRSQGLIDFDSMVYLAVKLLESNAEVRTTWQAQYRYVICDEAHDCSFDQIYLSEVIAQPENNLVRVFDPSQAIYGFRGGDAQAVIHGFENKKNYFLTTNYRSAPEIIEAVRPFAETDELSQKLWSEMRSGVTFAGRVSVAEYSGEYEEARAVVEDICASGLDYASCAVLARTKACLLSYAELFDEYGIPTLWRGKNFWEEREIIEATAFAAFALNPMDYDAFVYAACSSARETRYLGRKFVSATLATAKKDGISPAEVDVPYGEWPESKLDTWSSVRTLFARLRIFRDVPPADFLRDLQQRAGFGFSESQNEEPDDFQSENIEALIRRAVGFRSLAELVAHAGKMRKTLGKSNGVRLSTAHSAKGLEWQAVYVTSITEKIFPHVRSESFDEERRLMLVALSRAKEFLWVSSHGQKSIFLDMIPQSVKASAA